jgi:anti-sigma B factor antagonist
MLQQSLVIEDVAGSQDGQRILSLNGPLVLATLFEFQSKVIVDFSKVPFVDSAGIGALVGAYVTHTKNGRNLFLVGVSERIHQALAVTRVEQFFRFFDSLTAAQQAAAA